MKKLEAWIVVTESTGTHWMHNDHPTIYLDKALAEEKALSLDLPDGGHPSVVPCTIQYL